MNDQSSIKDLMNHSQEEIDQLLYGKKDNTVFFTDGMPDGMALYQAGIENIISLGTPEQKGVLNRASIVSYIASRWNTGRPLHKKIIVCAAKDTRQEWKALLNQLYVSLNDSDYLPEQILKYEFLPQKHYLKCDAISDAMSKDLNKFTNEIKAYKEQQEEQENPRPGNVLEYLESGRFTADQSRFQKGADAKTGFSQLDKKMGGGLYAGLYVLGAVPTLGKTTFILQIADQIAEQKKPVLFFSMEQSRLELVTKSITRIARDLYPGSQNEIKTSLQIRRGETTDKVQEAFNKYKNKIAANINIIEGNFETTVATISSAVQRFIERTKTRPVVIVDYLQILQPSKQTKASDPRLLVDQNVTELKRLSRNYEIPVIVISSFNRTNYKQTVDYESFKETSGIEYTADVLLGLEYKVIETLKGKEEQNTIREKVNEAKTKPEREIKLRCLKNRYGQSCFEIGFKYYPKYDYFREDTERIIKEEFKGIKAR